MACPYFLPTEKAQDLFWPFPQRLPLGSGFRGSCTASGEPQPAGENELQQFCNLGYARGCSRLPATRRSDAVRFSVGQDDGYTVILRYCCELDHAPVQHGELRYDCQSATWQAAHVDACIQRQAECYLMTYLEGRR